MTGIGLTVSAQVQPIMFHYITGILLRFQLYTRHLNFLGTSNNALRERFVFTTIIFFFCQRNHTFHVCSLTLP